MLLLRAFVFQRPVATELDRSNRALLSLCPASALDAPQLLAPRGLKCTMHNPLEEQRYLSPP